MAIVKAVKICPECQAEQVESQPTVCINPNCRHIFKRAANKYFVEPNCLQKQLRKELATLDQIARGHANTVHDQTKLERAAVSVAHNRMSRECSMELRLDAMQDAFHLLRHVLQADMSEAAFPEQLKRLIDLGKSVGRLSRSLEEFFASGGGRTDDEGTHIMHVAELKKQMANNAF